ncbi:hypothetical protein [Gordonia phthalatica]|uniref:Uncharacterized protein n=1 Tax=Gordonia phthalatica TaxID=1136941 RepID=A0A0N9MSY2_9ACTN|nr:hypothetical protein [Gordonia phthalatica]ALG86232.1 hypothetical protein ACH46_19225 [Gordonia phthalatica]
MAGIDLAVGYPQPSASGSDWYYYNNVRWSGSWQTNTNFAYTDQPFYTFGSRVSADVKANRALWGGVILGVMASLLTLALSVAVDLMFSGRRP